MKGTKGTRRAGSSGSWLGELVLGGNNSNARETMQGQLNRRMKGRRENPGRVFQAAQSRIAGRISST